MSGKQTKILKLHAMAQVTRAGSCREERPGKALNPVQNQDLWAPLVDSLKQFTNDFMTDGRRQPTCRKRISWRLRGSIWTRDQSSHFTAP